ncbi:U11/U12 small nuclear ribonucleoprotein 25 kDa protein-like isoform X2 [Dermacentor andersoni]|uniref:U11/U12 small nuclear ribonucleoprotein 25 kDa protein-like isoform X2 n=1 Tax=Dermacentor andersoni TaxID=34620 RepID=UPI00241731F6|nr:U11/U12 small nuclear ribonucleoprotein 25 kDa protein-like isoform X2 [Dermacentor andersoni]
MGDAEAAAAAIKTEDSSIPLPSDEEAEKVLSFQEAMAIADKKIHALISNDPLLNNLHPEVTTDELKSYLALEHGQAMSLVVHKADGDYYTVVVEQKATVLDLKNAIRRHVTLRMLRHLPVACASADNTEHWPAINSTCQQCT